MEVQQHTNTSRLSQWPQDETSSHISPHESGMHIHHTSQQFKKLRHIPMSKLSLNSIFLKKQHQKNLYKQHLSVSQNKTIHNYFYEMQEKFQDDIYDFMNKYQQKIEMADELQSLDQSISYNPSQTSSHRFHRQSTHEETNKETRKLADGVISPPSRSKESSKRVNEGGYFFNNWRSYESYPCFKAINQNIMNEDSSSLVYDQGPIDSLSAHLVYAVIDMDFDRALRIIDNITQIYSKRMDKDITKPKRINSIEGAKFVKEVIVNQNQNLILGDKKNDLKKLKDSSLNLKSLRMIIKGLQILTLLIKLTDELNNNNQLSETFFGREQFHLLQDHYLNDPRAKINLLNLTVQEIQNSGIFKEINESGHHNDNSTHHTKGRKKFDKQPSYNQTPSSPKQSAKTMKSTQNLVTFKHSPKKPKSIQQLRSFMQLQSKYQKICILNNLMFLINFSKKVRIESCENDYFKLLFCYLKNGQDQLDIFLREEVNFAYVSHNHNDNMIRQSPQLQEEDFSNLSQQSLKQPLHVNFKQQVHYMDLLLSLRHLKIYDRINFGARLLPKSKKIEFVSLLQQKMVRFPYLDNLLLFTKIYKQEMKKSILEMDHIDYGKQAKEPLPKPRKNSTDFFNRWSTLHQLQKQRSLIKQKIEHNIEVRDVSATKIRTICQNYIDQTSDLGTIAFLSNDFQCLEKYYDSYRQSLLLSYEEEQVQKLDATKQSSQNQLWTDKRTYLSKKCPPFLSLINFRQQKINQNTQQDNIQIIDSRKCQICSLKIFPDKRECYIECSKCKHGGHFQHMIKWYNSYQNCPNVNCSCLCN